MNRIFLTLILLCAGTSVWSSEIFNAPVNSRERALVQEVFSMISSKPVMIAEFEQTKTVASINRSFKSTGRLIFSSADGIAWLFEKPFLSTTLISDDRMIQIDSKGKKQEVVEKGNDLFARFSQMVQSVFLGDFDFIEQEYELYYQETGNGEWIIGLIPKDSFLKEIISAFELKGTQQINAFSIHEAGGDLIYYEFAQQEFPETLSRSDEILFQ